MAPYKRPKPGHTTYTQTLTEITIYASIGEDNNIDDDDDDDCN